MQEEEEEEERKRMKKRTIKKSNNSYIDKRRTTTTTKKKAEEEERGWKKSTRRRRGKRWKRKRRRRGKGRLGFVCWLVGCLTSQQQASVSQGRICSDNLTCCHTEIEVADQTFYLTQSQYTDTGPTSPSADPITPGAWQGSHWSANV